MGLGDQMRLGKCIETMPPCRSVSRTLEFGQRQVPGEQEYSRRVQVGGVDIQTD